MSGISESCSDRFCVACKAFSLRKSDYIFRVSPECFGTVAEELGSLDKIIDRKCA